MCVDDDSIASAKPMKPKTMKTNGKDGKMMFHEAMEIPFFTGDKNQGFCVDRPNDRMLNEIISVCFAMVDIFMHNLTL